MEEVTIERLYDLARSINESGLFDFDLNFAFDAGKEIIDASHSYFLLTGRWAGQKHKFELEIDSKEVLESILDVVSCLAKMKEWD
jgi:hypothetical protein